MNGENLVQNSDDMYSFNLKKKKVALMLFSYWNTLSAWMTGICIPCLKLKLDNVLIAYSKNMQ